MLWPSIFGTDVSDEAAESIMEVAEDEEQADNGMENDCEDDDSDDGMTMAP